MQGVPVSNVANAPVVEGLFTWSDAPPQLIGSRHRETGAVTFPADPSNDDLEEVLLSRTGTLFTWTTQEFVPPAPPYSGDTDPERFVPYAVGYVELPEGLLVEGRLTESDPAKLAIGQPMELVLVPFRTEPDPGDQQIHEILTFAFAPVPAGEVLQ